MKESLLYIIINNSKKYILNCVIYSYSFNIINVLKKLKIKLKFKIM